MDIHVQSGRRLCGLLVIATLVACTIPGQTALAEWGWYIYMDDYNTPPVQDTRLSWADGEARGWGPYGPAANASVATDIYVPTNTEVSAEAWAYYYDIYWWEGPGLPAGGWMDYNYSISVFIWDEIDVPPTHYPYYEPAYANFTITVHVSTTDTVGAYVDPAGGPLEDYSCSGTAIKLENQRATYTQSWDFPEEGIVWEDYDEPAFGGQATWDISVDDEGPIAAGVGQVYFLLRAEAVASSKAEDVAGVQYGQGISAVAESCCSASGKAYFYPN